MNANTLTMKRGAGGGGACTYKTWVGLTDEEIKDILDCGRGGLIDIKKAESKLREKNE